MLPYNQEGQAFFADFKDNTKNQHNKKLLEEYLSSKNIKRLTELFTEITSFNKILDAERQYLTKLLAFVIIKKIEQEALEQFKEERDPQNKLDVLSDSIVKIKKIQEKLLECLPETDSPIFSALKLPAADFAHFQNKDNEKVGSILDRLANKAFKMAYETSKAVIQSTDIAEQVFKPIFEISKNLKIGYEEKQAYINKIKEKISKIDNIEKNVRDITLGDVQLMSVEQAEKLFKDPKTTTANHIIVYKRDDHSVSYLLIKNQGVIRKYYLRNEQQYSAFNTFIKENINLPKTPNKGKNSPCLISAKDNKDIIDCFDSLTGADLKYPESQCKVAYNEFSGFRRFYREQQESYIVDKINVYLEKHGPIKNIDHIHFPKKNNHETDEHFNERVCEEIDNKIIPIIYLLLEETKKKFPRTANMQAFLDNMQQVLTNYHIGYKSESTLAKNYRSIKQFAETTLKTWENSTTTGYEKNINELLDAIRLNCNKFGYHKGYIVYLANYRLNPKDCKKTPTIVYDQITKRISYLIVNNGRENIKIPLLKLKIPTQQKFNRFIRQNLLKKPGAFGRVFLDYQNPLTQAITSMPWMRKENNLKNFIYAPTISESELHNDLKSTADDNFPKKVATRASISKAPTPVSSIRKLKFGNEDKFLIIKDAEGEVNIVHHHGGNRLYRPQDILPTDKNMPTELFLLGVGHFGDVKAGFLPSGEQKAIKVVRAGSTNNNPNTLSKRQFYKDVWDEREDDLRRELKGLEQNKKLIAYGVTRSYLKKITKAKKALLNVTEEKLDIIIRQSDGRVSTSSSNSSSTSRSSTSSQQEEQQQRLTFMAGKATHILMELSGKDLRDEIEENIRKEPQDDSKYYTYFIDRAIECCNILEEQHKTGTHNDFKPANIAVTRDGRLEIIDFGTYQANDAIEAKKQRLNPMVHGTPAFMSPSALKEIYKELDTQNMQAKVLFNTPVPPQTYTANNLKEYYIKRRLNDILGAQNIKIKNIKDIQQLIIKVLNAEYSPVPFYNWNHKAPQKRSKPSAAANLQTRHQSQRLYQFKSINKNIVSRPITWTVKEEIAFILKTIETELKTKSASRQISMGCDSSYDMYSLVSMISGTANKDAYLTNIILRYGSLNNEDLDLLKLANNNDKNDKDLTCPIQNYLGEGQGLQLDKLFDEIINANKLRFTPQQEQNFKDLHKKWLEARDNILLQQKSDKKLQPQDFKEILLKLKNAILGLNANVTNEEPVTDLNDKKTLVVSKNLEDFLNSTSKQDTQEFLHLKKSLIDQSQQATDKIKFITKLCYKNYPNNFSPKAIINFYKILTNIVFPVDDPEDDARIITNRKLAAGILFAATPGNYDISLLSKKIKQNLTANEVKTIELMRDTVTDKPLNIFNTILSPANISIFEEDFIDIRPNIWSRNIDAYAFFHKKEYTENLYALIEHNKLELFKKLFTMLSSSEVKKLKKELLWIRAVAEKFSRRNILEYLKEKNVPQEPTTKLLDQKDILDFMLKQCIKQPADKAPKSRPSCIRKSTRFSFVAPIQARPKPFDLSLYDTDTLNTLIEATKQANIPCKPSLIEQFIEALENAKKLRENPEQKLGSAMLLAYKLKQVETDYSATYAIFEQIKLHLNSFIIQKQQDSEEYKTFWDIFTKTKLNLNRLIIQRKKTNELSEKNERPTI